MTPASTLIIEVRGEVVNSTFPAFAEMVRTRLGEINRDLATDEDFDQADKDAKAIAGAEDALKAAKKSALAQSEELEALWTQIDALTGELSAARLDLKKQIDKRKDELREEIVEEFLGKFDIDASLARKHFLGGLQSAIKGKRTQDSMRTACRVFQTTQAALIGKCRGILDSFEKAHGADLIADRRELELEKPEGLEAELRRRFEAKRAREEKARLEAEAAKAKAEADAAKLQLAEAGKPPAKPQEHEEDIPPFLRKGTSNAEAGTRNGGEEAGCKPALPGVAMATSAADEWATFKEACKAAFAPLKEAREALRHEANIAKAQGFANSINQAWKEWT